MLVNELGLDLARRTRQEAVDVSDGGATIAGNGFDPQGAYRGWIVHLVPEAGSVALAGIALAALAALRTRHRFL